MPADTDTDHSIVCAEITTSAKTDGIGEQRPRGQPLHEWEDAQYKKHYEYMEAWQISEGKSDMDSETHRGEHRGMHTHDRGDAASYDNRSKKNR